MTSQIVLGGRFRVFEDGRIFRIVSGVETPMTPSHGGRGYAVVTYYEGKVQKHVYLHRLIAATFVPNPNHYPQVNHRDGNKRNNAASNLEWVTPKMNIRHAYKTGLMNPMATAQPCTYCGTFTLASDGICPKCKAALGQEAREIDRRTARIDRYSKIDRSLLSPREAQYVECAEKGLSICEIADRFDVSKQCVSAALLFAEKKSLRGTRLTKGQETKRISLSLKAARMKQKLAEAEAQFNIMKLDYAAAEEALRLFDASLAPIPSQLQESAT